MLYIFDMSAITYGELPLINVVLFMLFIVYIICIILYKVYILDTLCCILHVVILRISNIYVCCFCCSVVFSCV